MVENIGVVEVYNVEIFDFGILGFFIGCMLDLVIVGGLMLIVGVGYIGDLFMMFLVFFDDFLGVNMGFFVVNDDNLFGGGVLYLNDMVLIEYICMFVMVVQFCEVEINIVNVIWLFGLMGMIYMLVIDDVLIMIVCFGMIKQLLLILLNQIGNLGIVNIGEILCYQVIIDVFEGMLNNVCFEDIFDNGLVFVNVVFVMLLLGVILVNGGVCCLVVSIMNQGGVVY